MHILAVGFSISVGYQITHLSVHGALSYRAKHLLLWTRLVWRDEFAEALKVKGLSCSITVLHGFQIFLVCVDVLLKHLFIAG